MLRHIAASLIFFSAAMAQASVGELALDYSTFLYTTQERPPSSLTLGLGLGLEGGERTFGKLDIEALALSSSLKSSLTVDLREAYVGLRTEDHAHEGYFGRKLVAWSHADQLWQLGLWSPRFVGDPLHPEEIGKTGFFYHFTAPGFQAWVQASPVGIPERGFPITTQDGKLVAYSPFWTPPATLAIYSGTSFPLQYTIDYPATAREFWLRPNASVMTRFENGPYWAAAGYSYGPMQRTVISVEPGLGLSGDPRIEASIHPRFPYHHLITGEAGVGRKTWSFWGSLTRELTVREELPASWYSFPYGPAWIGSLGAGWQPLRGFSVAPSFLRVSEERGGLPRYLDSIPWVSRFGFEDAARLDLDWKASRTLDSKASWTHDLENTNDLISADLIYGLSELTVGLGFDLLLTSTDQGFIGQYLGNDRVRWKVNYAF